MNHGSTVLHRKCSVVNRESTGVLLSRGPGLYRGNVGKVRTQFISYEMCPGASQYTGCPAWLHRHSENGLYTAAYFFSITTENCRRDRITGRTCTLCPPWLLIFSITTQNAEEYLCVDRITVGHVHFVIIYYAPPPRLLIFSITTQNCRRVPSFR